MDNVSDAVTEMISLRLEAKDFSTGSKGFFVQGKITLPGERFQTQVQAILVGSKADPTLAPSATPEEIGVAMAQVVAKRLAPRTFTTGRSGYSAVAKIVVCEQRYQVNIQAVRL